MTTAEFSMGGFHGRYMPVRIDTADGKAKIDSDEHVEWVDL